MLESIATGSRGADGDAEISQTSYEQDEHRNSWNNEEVMEKEAISDKGMMGKGLLWLEQMFPRLFSLTFDIPSGEPSLDAFARYGRDATRFSDESGSGSDSGDHGDKSGDYVGTASRGGNAAYHYCCWATSVYRRLVGRAQTSRRLLCTY
jgi:hypothetical protein